MADSNITKRALSTALKELMTKEAFHKISVADICEKCAMNRKSFYYHFKDKYDLVNWIFDTEFIAIARNIPGDTVPEHWFFLESLCEYFYENKSFYQKALQIKGQNSFSDHFREFLQPIIKKRFEEMITGQEIRSFYIDFFADAIICAIERWLLELHDISANEFICLMKTLVQHIAVVVCQDMQNETSYQPPS